MNRLPSLALALLAPLAAAATSHAQVYTGYTIATGTVRVVTAVNQSATSGSNATSTLVVQRWSGAIEAPVFSYTSPSSCIATGPDYQIVMTNVGLNRTSILIQATSSTCSIRSVTFGASTTKCGFDLTNPSTGTTGSSVGLNPVPAAMGGAWSTSIKFDNAVKLATAPIRGDLFSRMTVNFSSVFNGGDVWQFEVDTDYID
jgi:hypothetical protein